MKSKVYIISERKSPRLLYVLDEIFNSHLSLSYEIVDNESSCPENSHKIFYSRESRATSELQIFQHDLLFQEDIHAQSIEVITSDKKPYFFQSFAFKGDFHFDLFALVFYMLSRYEEYLRFIPDSFGRFASSQSLASRSGFLNLPIVDLWIIDLKRKMEEKWSIDIPLKRKYQIAPTFDIDTPYAYLHRPIYYHIGAIVRDVYLRRWHRIIQRFRTYSGKQRDLFDTYDLIFSILKENGQNALFFFLMNLDLPNDQNFSKNSKAFRNLIRHISSNYKIGIHPSLQAQQSSNQWTKEYELFKRISDKNINHSRQHFLYLKFPKTYQNLLNHKIKQDYSMGFHDHSGFRAGTSVPFSWYNLGNEKKEELTIHPVLTMDVTLKMYQNLSPRKAISEIDKLKAEVKKVDGTFSFIWHNSSFSDLYRWNGWQEVLEAMIKK